MLFLENLETAILDSAYSPSEKIRRIDATPKSKHETVVSYEFADDPIPPSTCCCGKVKIQVGCRIVAICSLLAIIANAVLYFFGIPRLGLSGTIEIFLLIVDFLTVFFLFLGLSKQRAGLLKPFLFFNSLWTLCLCLLLLVCLWKIIRGGELSNNILSNLQNIRAQPTEPPEDDYHHHRVHPTASISTGVSCLVTAAVMLGLVTIIVVDGFFVHIVYRTFHFFAYQEDKAKENRNNQTATTTL
ncbi:hypothetical protein Y032_0122g1053 [Ancylostoma ceylanicum]|uniref:Uncharacterized protein n=1 Tax=Ancylostoma ceylanicum TaxID=53326 RepID=A0A016T8Z1_9BILA|nr:hypothetical protein Y032_0122g1053 [Ancylostoma ceylanicum]